MVAIVEEPTRAVPEIDAAEWEEFMAWKRDREKAAQVMASGKKVYLALPTYANAMRRDFVMSLLDMLWINPIPGIEWTVGTAGGDGVGRSRNNLAQQFLLATDCDIYFPIDVDIVFSRHSVARLLSHVCKERPIVGGLYAAKTIDHRWIMTPIEGEVPDPETGLQKVMESGTGIKAFHRRYFEEVMNAFPEIQYFCDGVREARGVVKWDFFSMGVVDFRYLSEDYYADHRARLLGIPIYVDTRCQVEHEGFIRYPFPSNLEIFKNMSIDKLFSLAESMGNTAPREFAVNERVVTHAMGPRAT